ncbi:MAG: (d)CMP kinase [Candidatus Hodarchaeota archaeon]
MLGYKVSFIEQLKRFEDPKVQKRGLSITVSGLSGSGKSTFAKTLAKELDLKYVSAGQIQRDAAKKEGLSLTVYSEKVAQTQGEFDLIIDREMLKHAQKGGVVIDGRISGFVAGEYADARFLVYVTDPKIVAQRVFEREEKDTAPEETLNLLTRRDRADRIRYKKFYGISVDETSIYAPECQIDNTNLTKDQLIALTKQISNDLKEKFGL